jgi:hypothetical protein
MKGTPEQIGRALIAAIRTWTPEQKAAARAHLNRWHAAIIWEAENPGRLYTKELRN